MQMRGYGDVSVSLGCRMLPPRKPRRPPVAVWTPARKAVVRGMWPNLDTSLHDIVAAVNALPGAPLVWQDVTRWARSHDVPDPPP